MLTLPVAPKLIAEKQAGTSTTALNNTKTSVAGASGVPAIIRFGPMRLANGKVLFSDRFVKPNYSADLTDLTDLTGQLSAFSSVSATGTPDMAELELRGRADDTAWLEILGKLNPLATPLASDIVGKVRDLKLAPLTPYATKYSGYGINRGKLSVDVEYLVQPNGQLTANDKLVLNQLAFGDKVEGSTASLPVKLAVALLADRNDVINLDLPISGSLNDPQLSPGPIIIMVIINVIGKAVTAPLSLLTKAVGGAGGNEPATVGCAAGSARLEPDAKAALDLGAKALEDRPALLKEVYQRIDLTKPRNLLGMAKNLPDADMEKLLLASISVNDEAIRGLALQRSVAVKDCLASKGLPVERLFLGAAKSVALDAKWTPRAELNLAVP